MKNLIIAYRSFFKNGQNNIIKILSLGTGLAMALVLISKIYFEQTYDDFYPDSERIYKIETYVKKDNSSFEYGNVSGAVAPGMKAEIPQVEAATRATSVAYEAPFFTADKKRFVGSFILADSCFFDVLPRPMIAGVAKDVLSRPLYVMISHSIAKKMGGDPIGKTITIDQYPGRILTIGGIFEDVPENSHYRYDAIISLNSISNFMGDGSMNWLGNDRYWAYVKLAKGTDPKSLGPAIHNMQKKYQDLQAMKDAGYDEFTYKLVDLTKVHSGSAEVKRMLSLLSILAFSILFTAVMNYTIIVLSTLIGRTKQIAIYKCYGASDRDIIRLSFSETVFHLFLSLAFAVLLILVFQSTIEEVLSVSIGSLFSLRTCLTLLIICIVITIFTAIVPSRLLSRIPVTAAFRNMKKSRRKWILGLLFVQFVATTFLVILVAIVNKQHNMMVNDNPGYNYENVFFADVKGASDKDKETAIQNLASLPEVDVVSTASCLPLEESFSGNNVSLEGEDRELFHITDLYYVGENYFELMQITIEGKTFSNTTSIQGDMIISRSFADRLRDLGGWTDSPVGKRVKVSEHGICTITGVYENIRLGSITNENQEPSAMFFKPTPNDIIVIKTKGTPDGSVSKIYDTLKSSIPEKDIVIYPYKDQMIKLYTSSYLFGKSVIIGALVTLVITLIGLIGYIKNETNRRKSEIAIRKVNGAKLSEILSLFSKNILWIALPALLLGSFIAAYTSEKWMEDFSKKVELSPLFFIICATIVLVIIQAVIIINCLKAANQNPVDALKND